MLRHDWTLLFHEGVTLQLRKLQEAAARAEQNDLQGFESNANAGIEPSDHGGCACRPGP